MPFSSMPICSFAQNGLAKHTDPVCRTGIGVLGPMCSSLRPTRKLVHHRRKHTTALVPAGSGSFVSVQPNPCSSRRAQKCHRSARQSVRTAAAAANESESSKVRGFWPVAKLKQLLLLLPSYECVKVMDRLVRLLWRHLWAVIFVYCVKDMLQFSLHRVTHRLTNHAAEAIFQYPVLQEAINPWWLVMDQSFLQQYPGYQMVMGAFFLVALPLNLLLSACAGAIATLLTIPPSSPPLAASTTTPPAAASSSETQISQPTSPSESARSADTLSTPASPTASTPHPAGPSNSDSSRSSSSSETTGAGAAAAVGSPSSSSSSATITSSAVTHRRGKGLLSSIGAGWQDAASTLPQVKGMLGRVWVTEMVVSAIGLLLQGGMMLVLPIPWLLPIYLQAHLAGVTSVLEGYRGLDAIKRSGELITGSRRVVFWPLLALILFSRFADWLKLTVFAVMPPRLWNDAVEVPLALIVVTHLAPLLINRLQDLLPMAMYLHLREQPKHSPTSDAEHSPAATPPAHA